MSSALASFQSWNSVRCESAFNSPSVHPSNNVLSWLFQSKKRIDEKIILDFCACIIWEETQLIFFGYRALLLSGAVLSVTLSGLLWNTTDSWSKQHLGCVGVWKHWYETHTRKHLNSLLLTNAKLKSTTKSLRVLLNTHSQKLWASKSSALNFEHVEKTWNMKHCPQWFLRESNTEQTGSPDSPEKMIPVIITWDLNNGSNCVFN